MRIGLLRAESLWGAMSTRLAIEREERFAEIAMLFVTLSQDSQYSVPTSQVV